MKERKFELTNPQLLSLLLDNLPDVISIQELKIYCKLYRPNKHNHSYRVFYYENKLYNQLVFNLKFEAPHIFYDYSYWYFISCILLMLVYYKYLNMRVSQWKPNKTKKEITDFINKYENILKQVYIYHYYYSKHRCNAFDTIKYYLEALEDVE